MIDVRGLCFDYPGQRALHDVTLAVRAGSITALVGPNGSGKTTLLRCLAALAEPVSGSIVLDGVDVLAHPRECHRRVGYLSDFHGLWEQLSVQRSLLYAGRAHGLSGATLSQRVRQTAAELGIENLLGSLTGALSRGQRQRVAIAQAVLHQPRVLLLDEPAAGLDPEARFDLSALLRGLADSAMSVLVSSHILAELDDYCSDMLVLREGRVVEHQPVAGVAAGSVAFRVELSGDTARAATIAAAEEGVVEARVEGDGLRVQLRDEAGARERLLRHLLGNGVAVTGFGAARERLQEAYMARVRKPADDGGGS